MPYVLRHKTTRAYLSFNPEDGIDRFVLAVEEAYKYPTEERAARARNRLHEFKDCYAVEPIPDNGI